MHKAPDAKDGGRGVRERQQSQAVRYVLQGAEEATHVTQMQDRHLFDKAVAYFEAQYAMAISLKLGHEQSHAAMNLGVALYPSRSSSSPVP